MHAPFLDPGGALFACLITFRAAAFRWSQCVGFPPCFVRSYPYWTTMNEISRLDSAAYILDPPSSVLPLPGLHVGFSTALLARL